MDRGELDPQGLFVLHGRGRLLGAILCHRLPGESRPHLAAAVRPDKRRSLFEDALLRCAAAWLKTRHVKVAQALLSPAEAERAAALPRNGFAHVTHLLFFARDLALFPRGPSPAAAWNTRRAILPTHHCFTRRYRIPTKTRSIVPN